MKADLYRFENRCEQLRAENISIMKRLHWFDKKEAEEKEVQRQKKTRMEKEEEIRQNVHIEEEESKLEEIRQQ